MLLSISTVHSFLLLSSSALWASLVAQIVKNLPALQETGFDPWGGKIFWRREWLAIPVLLPGEFHGQRSLAGWTVHEVTESDMTKQLSPFFTYAILILIYSERYELKLIFSNIEIQLFQLFVKKIILSPLNCLCHLIKQQLIKWMWV